MTGAAYHNLHCTHNVNGDSASTSHDGRCPRRVRPLRLRGPRGSVSRLRARCATRRPSTATSALGFWALSRHADVLAGFKDVADASRAATASRSTATRSTRTPTTTMSFLAMDPPRHTRMRALVSRGFTPRRVAELEPRIRAHRARSTSTRCVGRGALRLHPRLRRQAADGRDQRDARRARRRTARTLRDLGRPRRAPRGGRAGPAAGGGAGGAAHAPATSREMLARPARRSPRDDLTGALLAAEIDGDRLADREIIGFLFLMIVAGNETTTKLLGNALYWLWRNPDERDAAARRPDADPALGRGDAALRQLDAGARARSSRATSSCTARSCAPATRRAAGRLGQPRRARVSRPRSLRPAPRHAARASPSARAPTSASARRSRASRAASRSRRSGGASPTTRSIPPALVRVHSVNVRGFAALPIRVRAGGAMSAQRAAHARS